MAYSRAITVRVPCAADGMPYDRTAVSVEELEDPMANDFDESSANEEGLEGTVMVVSADVLSRDQKR
mgnify:CR=1 FL=1